MSLIFSILKDVLRRKDRVERPAIRLPEGFNALRQCRDGPMVYNRHDIYVGGSIEKYGEFSKGEADFFRNVVRQGMHVVEVGANIGAHTVGLSRLVSRQGRIYAFEPQRLVFQSMCANLALNQCDNVFAYMMAAGDKDGEIVVPTWSHETRNNFGGLSLLNQTAEGDVVPLVTLDSLNLKRLDFLKADVEGMECDVLRGARETIEACRPALFLENDRKERSAELIALVQSLRYRAWWHVTPLFSPDNFAGDLENIFSRYVSVNMFCLPWEADSSCVSSLREITGPEDDWQRPA